MSTSDHAVLPPNSVTRVASLGGGVIGQSWTALFLAAGKSVAVYDPDPATEKRVRQAIETAWPALVELGLAAQGNPDNVSFCDDARAAVDGAQFVQESVPERIDMKHELYATIEPAVGPETVVASSASGLTLREMQAGWRRPDRFVLGHPFNPPHLIPLVEVMGNDDTGPGVVEWARMVYESVGKVTIELKREVPGHVANRLQAALWREVINLVNEGVASVEDIDTAVSAGPGLRWAAMGPTQLFHLGAGEGGLAAFCERYAESFNRWFDSLGRPHLDKASVESLVEGLASIRQSHSIQDLSNRRDALITGMISLTRNGRQPPIPVAPQSTRTGTQRR